MNGVTERENGVSHKCAAQDVGNLELCLLEEDAGMLSAGSTDASAPELVSPGGH